MQAVWEEIAVTRLEAYTEFHRRLRAIERVAHGTYSATLRPSWRHPVLRYRWNRGLRSMRFTANYLAIMGWDPDADRARFTDA